MDVLSDHPFGSVWDGGKNIFFCRKKANKEYKLEPTKPKSMSSHILNCKL